MIECLYDEDLTENLFFQDLKKSYKHLIDQATSDDWIVCIPKAGSFEHNSLTEEDFLYHILTPHEDLGNQYLTLNKKKVKVYDKIITIQDEKVGLSSRILFEETFYTENLLKYKVWCVECLLNQSYVNSKFKKSDFNALLTLRECIDFLWAETAGKGFIEQLDLIINNFLVKNTPFYQFSLQLLREFVNNLYKSCLQVTLCDEKLQSGISMNKNVLNNINVSVEAYMQHNIYKELFSSILVHTASDDASFNKIIRNLSDIQLHDLDIMQNVHDSIPYSKRQLAKINRYNTILGKINCLRHTISEISQCTSKTQSMLSVDDLLPVFVFIILKSSVPNWIANLCFVKQFQFCEISNGDESMFLITTLEAAIEYIKSGILLIPSDNFQLYKSPLGGLYKNTISNLFENVHAGNYDEVKHILEENANNKVDSTVKTKELCHPLCTCDNCDKLLANISLSTSPTVFSSDDKGVTALHAACMSGKPKIVELLLEFGADLSRPDYSGAMPLHYAAMRGHQNALLLLLHSGANINSVDNEKNTPLHYSCNNGHDACVKALLYFAEHKMDAICINCQNLVGDTALHNAAKWGYKSIVYNLLEYGADSSVENNLKKTPVDYAHNLDICRILTKTKCVRSEKEVPCEISHRTDAEEIATKPSSPQQMKKAELLLRAVAYDDYPMICYYLGIQAPKSSSDELCHPLCTCENCETSSISSINSKDKQNINVCNSEGYTALHVASLHGQTETVQLLLNNNALPNITTKKGLTPLHLACQTQRLDIVKLLLNLESCKINLQDVKGNTPLHYACHSRDVSIVQELITRKANVLIKNLVGKTALDEINEKKINIKT